MKKTLTILALGSVIFVLVVLVPIAYSLFIRPTVVNEEITAQLLDVLPPAYSGSKIFEERALVTDLGTPTGRSIIYEIAAADRLRDVMEYYVAHFEKAGWQKTSERIGDKDVVYLASFVRESEEVRIMAACYSSNGSGSFGADEKCFGLHVRGIEIVYKPSK